ncbi:hypothetical protein PS623_04562 [Pseudomonas fluorescens]|uniref:hypothetical protein n=1 Tax=Pseudomonas fluorescens TaxID=294 RepID=UPI001241E5E6|nr:hypothetical protein [Pseudomonas fluorescens]VVN26520.1 hypothetical protein PS623_04562 [Pseudomonas fluorescens]
MNVKKFAGLAFLAVTLAVASGCSTIERLEANALADRAKNPQKYQEIPEVAQAQKSANQNGPAYPEFCTFGCPDQHEVLTRNW